MDPLQPQQADPKPDIWRHSLLRYAGTFNLALYHCREFILMVDV
jgi:hypothetical protein